jgi:predicted nucleotidyltransferase
MSEEKEESAIDVIYKLEEKFEYLENYLKILDNNIKLILNKQNNEIKLLKELLKKQPGKITVTPGLNTKESQNESDKLVIGNVKVFGFIVDQNRTPIIDVDVIIYDESGDIIKRRKSDGSGHWEVRLPAGKYGVEYSQEGYQSINKTIVISKMLKEYEVK